MQAPLHTTHVVTADIQVGHGYQLAVHTICCLFHLREIALFRHSNNFLNPIIDEFSIKLSFSFGRERKRQLYLFRR